MPHIPVMVAEVISYLIWDCSGKYVDCTVGDGMHGHTILDKIASRGGSLVGLDRDDRALMAAEKNLSHFGDRVVLKKMRFSEIFDKLVVDRRGSYSGFLFDLGLNYSRLEEPAAGFSYLIDGPLDMRMSREDGLTAAEIVNSWSEKELADLFYYSSDERHSRRIARAIVKSRAKGEIKTTFRLKEIIFGLVRGPHRLKSAARCFQSLRMAVNNEIEELEQGLSAVLEGLIPGGRLVVISYHSIEDRVVKTFLREHNPRRGYRGERGLNVLTGKPLKPTLEEQKANPAARSAKLRAAELIETADG